MLNVYRDIGVKLYIGFLKLFHYGRYRRRTAYGDFALLTGRGISAVVALAYIAVLFNNRLTVCA